jgi:hypothetical protein
MDKIFATKNGVEVREELDVISARKNLLLILPLALAIWLGTGKNANDSMVELGTIPCLDIMLMDVFFVGNIVLKLVVFSC